MRCCSECIRPVPTISNMYSWVDILQTCLIQLCWYIFRKIRKRYHRFDCIRFDLSNPSGKSEISAPKAVVSKILVRYARSYFEPPMLEHFIVKKERLARIEDVIDPSNDRVVLYTVNPYEAIFVELPHPISEYSATKAPWLTNKLFRDAIRTITIPISELHRLAGQYGDPKVPIVIVWSPGRSGSTLLGKLVDKANPRVLSLSEPGLFYNMDHLITASGMDKETARWILKSALRVFFAPMMNYDGVFVKLTGFSIHIMADVSKQLPGLRHVHLARRDKLETIRSFVRVLYGIIETKLSYLRTVHPFFRKHSDAYIYYYPPDIEEIAEKAGLKTSLWEQISKVYAGFELAVQKTMDQYDETIFFEDLIKDPQSAIRRILVLLQLPDLDLDLDEMKECMKKDSQAGTPFSRTRAERNEKRLLPLFNDAAIKERIQRFLDLMFPDGGTNRNEHQG